MSFQSQLVKLVSRWMIQPSLKPHLKVDNLRRLDMKKLPTSDASGCTYEDTQIEGVRVIKVQPPQVNDNGLLFYLPGGAYVSGPSSSQLQMVSRIAADIGRVGWLVCYRLAPEHTYPASMDDAVRVYDVARTQFNADNIAMLGDSAGGGLALGLTMRLRDNHEPMPYKLALFSPWLDITMSNPDIAAVERYDTILSSSGLIEAGKLYAGDNDPKYPYLSPIYGDLTGLPPTLLQIGTHDVFIADCRKFRQQAEAVGASLQYTEAEKMVHVYTSMFAIVPEARPAIAEAIAFLQD